VSSSVAILIANFILTQLMLLSWSKSNKFPKASMVKRYFLT
jgi:hypothetical protein